MRDAVGRERMLRCDRLACGFSLVPNTQLGQMLGCGLGERRGLAVDALMRTSVPGKPPVPRHLLAPARVATLAGTESPRAP